MVEFDDNFEMKRGAPRREWHDKIPVVFGENEYAYLILDSVLPTLSVFLKGNRQHLFDVHIPNMVGKLSLERLQAIFKTFKNGNSNTVSGQVKFRAPNWPANPTLFGGELPSDPKQYGVTQADNIDFAVAIVKHFGIVPTFPEDSVEVPVGQSQFEG